MARSSRSTRCAPPPHPSTTALRCGVACCDAATARCVWRPARRLRSRGCAGLCSLGSRTPRASPSACGSHRARLHGRPCSPLTTAHARTPRQIFEKAPEQVKNIGIWFRYDSRTGTHNAYKEYREVSLTNAVNSLYQNMAGLSRAKAASIQILKTAALDPSDCKRPAVKQFHVRPCPLRACARWIAATHSAWRRCPIRGVHPPRLREHVSDAHPPLRAPLGHRRTRRSSSRCRTASSRRPRCTAPRSRRRRPRPSSARFPGSCVFVLSMRVR